MKKHFFLYIFCLLTIILISCKQHSQAQDKTEVRKVKLEPQEVYRYHLGQFGREEGAGIEEKARHAQRSEIERKGADVYYVYQPEEGFQGKDTVVLFMNKGSIGTGRGKKSLLKIEFVVK